MRTFFTAALGGAVGTLIGLVLLGGIALMMIGSFVGNLSKPADLPETMVLSVDLRSELSDQAPRSGPEVLFGSPIGFIDVLMRLDAAKSDERVKGIFVRGAEFGVGSSRAEELRAAFKDFQESGKFIIAHSQGTYGGGPSSFRAIATADEIWVQPGSDTIASGIAFETLFMKDLLDNLSITADIEALYEFKNAPNTYNESTFTEPHREAMTSLINSLWDVSLQDISKDRDLSVEEVRSALESSPISVEQMLEFKMADTDGWPEDARDAALERAGENSSIVTIGEYVAPSSKFGAPAIAVVGGQGPIVTGGSDASLFSEGNGFASDAIAASLLEAAENEKVEAIVFRVDSPGGSPVASDQIWRAIERIKTEHEKPVIVSMASVAASGGYYVSTGADYILANESTITGSIGIFGGKLAYAEGLARIGVNAESIAVGGPFSGAFTTSERFTDEQRTMMRAWLKRGYDRFINLVAEGREMTYDEVHERARGRVWSGADAASNNLVDEIGGLMAAIGKARELAEIDPDAEIRIIQYPMQSSGFPFGGPMVSASADQLNTIGAFSDALDDPRIQVLLEELEAAKGGTIQARSPTLIER